MADLTAHYLHYCIPPPFHGPQSSSTTLDLYLDSLGKAVAQQFRDRENLAETHT